MSKAGRKKAARLAHSTTLIGCQHRLNVKRSFLQFMSLSKAVRGGVCSCCNIPAYRFCLAEKRCFDCCDCAA